LPKIFHEGLHTNTYYTAVENMLGKAATKEQAMGILKGIGNKLAQGLRITSGG
jgi:hypothetical protein